MTNPIRRALLGALPALGILTAAGTVRAQEAGAGNKVVYHISDTRVQATAALRSIRNHMDDAPDTHITVVTHADGVDMMMMDAHDANDPDIDYPSLISALAARGVRFEICSITLQRRGLDEDLFVMDADFVPSGVARITELQTREGHAYIKP